MGERLANQLRFIVGSTKCSGDIEKKSRQRIEQGRLTRDEGPETHFCVYFAAYDQSTGEVYIGHHKKADLWLFNGGHIDESEIPLETLAREIQEEWGEGVKISGVETPSLLTITPINNPIKQTCRWHYDIWYFVPVDRTTFDPDEALLAKEFYQSGWKTILEAQGLITDPNTLEALKMIEEISIS